MSDTDDIKTVVREILIERMSLAVDTDEADLIADGTLDSLGFVDLVFNLETEFGVVVSLEHLDMNNFKSVNHITEYVVQHRT